MCEVCGRATYKAGDAWDDDAPEPCLRVVNPNFLEHAARCYQLGYERLRAENARLWENLRELDARYRDIG